MTVQETPFTVLVPLDGSSLALQAIPYAAAIGGKNGELILATVAPAPEPQTDERGWRLPMTEQDQERAIDTAKDYLLSMAEQWLPGRKGVRAEVTFGDPSEELLGLAERHHADLIVMASHGRGALGRLRFGSVADRVSRSSPVPVLIVRAVEGDVELKRGRIGRFIVALDGSERAEQALPVVRSIAQRTGDAVHLVTVVPSADVLVAPVPWMGPPVVPQNAGETIVAIERESSDRLAEISAELADAGIETTWSVAVGKPFDEIDRLANPQDVIVLTSHGRSGLERWALGSLAEKLVRNARALVLIVRARKEPSAAGSQ
jgi:nucleotide-binding universal stress UspA family protein